MKRALYKQLAGLLQAIENCRKSNNTKWEELHEESISSLVDNYMPSGSGIDSGTKLSLEDSRVNRLVFTFSYHHMNDGMYSRWTDHKLIVTPSLVTGFDMRITGRDYNDTKDYLYQVYEQALSQEI